MRSDVIHNRRRQFCSRRANVGRSPFQVEAEPVPPSANSFLAPSRRSQHSPSSLLSPPRYPARNSTRPCRHILRPFIFSARWHRQGTSLPRRTPSWSRASLNVGCPCQLLLVGSVALTAVADGQLVEQRQLGR